MKQQKFFVGDKVVRTQYMGNYEPINGSVAIVTAVELDEEDGNFYLRFKDLPSEKWDADYFSIVERSWQENAGDYSANNAPVDEDTYIEVLFEGSTSPSVVMVEKEWWENTKGMVKWRIADEYENPEVLFEQEQPATAQPPVGAILGEELAAVDTDKFWCETCEGCGTIDETLGGEHFSNHYAKCPDCDGKGYWEKKKVVVDTQKTNQEWTDKHYSTSYTLTQQDIANGFVKIDPYFVSKMWKIGSKDDSGALWHCFKTIARFGEKNSREREIKALYAQIKRLAEIEGVVLE